MRSLLASDRAVVCKLVDSFATHSLSTGQSQHTRAASKYFEKMERFISARELRNITIAAFLVAGVLAGIVAPWIGGVVMLTAVGAVWSTVKIRARARSNAIERDLPALLTSVASSVRAGIDPLQAIVDSEGYFPTDSPLVEEVQSFKRKLAAGDDETKIVESFLARDDNRDAELFKQCLLLSRKHGSSLSEPLHRVVRVVRQHQSFKRKTRAALAMHRMSAIGIMVCALLTASLQVLMNFEGVQAAFADPRGVVLLSIGGSLIVLGVLWMMRMGTEEAL